MKYEVDPFFDETRGCVIVWGIFVLWTRDDLDLVKHPTVHSESRNEPIGSLRSAVEALQ